MGMKPECTEDGCHAPQVGRGLCNKHWKAWRRRADPSEVRKKNFGTLEERWWARVIRAGGDECWEWDGAHDSDGYAQIGVNGRALGAHVVGYQVNVGPVPEGMELDHFACDNRSCVNFTHVRPDTHANNVMREGSKNVGAINARKTQCPKGHEYTPENTYIVPSTGGRACRTCQREYNARWKENRTRAAASRT